MYQEFKIPFWFNTRPENCKSIFLKRLKEVGSYRISFGIECGNESFRNSAETVFILSDLIHISNENYSISDKGNFFFQCSWYTFGRKQYFKV